MTTKLAFYDKGGTKIGEDREYDDDFRGLIEVPEGAAHAATYQDKRLRLIPILPRQTHFYAYFAPATPNLLPR